MRRKIQEFDTDETFSAGGDLALQAGQDLTLRAATVASEGGGIALAAGRDVNLLAASETQRLQVDESMKTSSTFSSTRTTTRDEVVDTRAVGTTLSGETVQIGAGRDITTRAAQVVGTGDVLLAAGRHIDIGTAENTHTESHDKAVRKSGLMSGTGVGVHHRHAQDHPGRRHRGDHPHRQPDRQPAGPGGPGGRG